ncbi:obscurin-like isoform X1 [Notolabrus celidotus]|uniref:obscurin-like isoform X1 n=1 Tax=Notolabrus celidotus TaxID=1203425 RepID=UPI00148F6237|nr:obscurin-like isoform X1 [Notolabrus celidotus]
MEASQVGAQMEGTLDEVLSDGLTGTDPTAHITLKYNWSQIFWGETVTFRCEIKGGGDTDWTYGWRILSLDQQTEKNEYSISDVTESHNGEYKCLGRNNHPQIYTDTQWSDPYRLTVTPYRPRAELNADSRIIQPGGVVTLTCNVIPPSSGWEFFWYRGERTAELKITQDARFTVSQGGLYWCRGGRGDPRYYTQYSSQFTINRILTNRAVVTRQPHWSEIYSGERITLRCEIHDGEVTEWMYEWETTGSNTFTRHSEDAASFSGVVYSGDECKCMGRHKTDFYSSTEWSSPITLTVSAHKPKAELRADNRDIPVGGSGGSVSLTCSVNLSSGWKYQFWYKEDKLAQPKALEDSGATSAGQIHVSEEGLYWCRGERGDPAYYTENSEMISINKKNGEKAGLTQHPNWSEIYYGEKITLRCEIEGVDDNEWEYEWETTSSSATKPTKQKEFSVRFAYTSHSGDYKCRGRKQSDKSSTLWSTPITLTVLYGPKPLLTVTPSWLSPGDSVTLNCEVKHPSAGWRFFWYKVVPKLPGDSYSYDLLSESSNGTEWYSLIVEGQTHTAGYVCRAGRGDPVFYTDYSKPKFVWSADLSSASLRVSPDRVQHFNSDSVSLSCEGNSTRWRVMRTQKGSTVEECASWWIKTDSSCTIPTYSSSNDPFWCESESGEFSNAVNVTQKNLYIILESPVHPVTEGSSVSLSFKLRNIDMVPPVFFYHNDKLIQNDSRTELNISAVSKSDEGFYRCRCSGKESAQSWMTVRAVSKSGNSFPVVLVIVGLICGVLLVVLLLLLYRYRQAVKDRCCIRSMKSRNIDQNAAGDRVGGQMRAHHDEYAAPLHGDASLYDSIKDPGESANGTGAGQFQDVTYSLLELKNTRKKGKESDPNEIAVYSEVKIATADETLMYAQVICQDAGKGKKKKGKPKSAATEDPVYSAVKSGTALGQ